MDANALLRRLSITVEILRVESQINYRVIQDERRILMVYDKAEKIESLSYSQETAERMFEREEIPELEYNVSLSDVLKKSKK